MMYLHEVEVKLKRKYSTVDVLKKITSPDDAVDYARAAYYNNCDDSKEHMFVLFLSRSNKVIGHKLISIGSATGCICDIKEILSVALSIKAEGIMMFHNHPSGSLEPSHADKMLTQKLKEACQYLDLKLLDHIIIETVENKHFSLSEEGIL